MKRLVVDRIEGEFAVCETEEGIMVNICLSDFPFAVKEGSVIYENNGNYELSVVEEERRRKELFELAESLFDE